MISSNHYPLRKVVGHYFDEFGARHDRLECGHTMRARQDFVGEINAARRRCRKCPLAIPLRPRAERGEG